MSCEWIQWDSVSHQDQVHSTLGGEAQNKDKEFPVPGDWLFGRVPPQVRQEGSPEEQA